MQPRPNRHCGAVDPLLERTERVLELQIKRPQSKAGPTPQSSKIPLHDVVPYTHEGTLY
jgi:hypothetical protein